MSQRVLKLCLLGAGRMGAQHAANIAGHPRAVLHRVVDVQPEAARAVAAAHGGTASSDIGAALADPDVDGVLVVTSTDTHLQLVAEAVAAGKPVLCEKPLDQSLARVDQQLEALVGTGVPIQLGFNRRFDPELRHLHDHLRAGDAGPIEILRITSRDPAPPPLAYVRVSGGLFRDMTIHDFDLARWLLGEEPVAVSAVASCVVDPAIGEAGDVDTAVITLRTARGALAVIDNSRRAAYGYDQRVEVHAARARLQAGGQPAQSWSDRFAESFVRELDHFLDVVEGRVRPYVGAADGRAALALAEAAGSAYKSGRTVLL